MQIYILGLRQMATINSIDNSACLNLTETGLTLTNIHSIILLKSYFPDASHRLPLGMKIENRTEENSPLCNSSSTLMLRPDSRATIPCLKRSLSVFIATVLLLSSGWCCSISGQFCCCKDVWRVG